MPAEETKMSVADREIDILRDVLSQMKMDDIGLSYVGDELVARDGGNEWRGTAFYHFLVDEAMNFDGNGELVGMVMDAEVLADFKELAEQKGVPVVPIQTTPRYTVEQTSDAFADPFFIRDNTVPEGRDGQYYDVDGIYQTFETEEEAQEYADILNSAEHIVKLFAAKDAEREAEQKQDNSDLIGKEITIDNRRYLIESIGEISGDASMRDITFQNNVGFPINRVEKIGYVRRLLEQAEKELPPEEKAEAPAEPTTAKPSAPALSADRHNYHITDDALGVGGAKEKFRNNMAAVNLLHELQLEDRLATPEEQETLAKNPYNRQLMKNSLTFVKCFLRIQDQK